MNFLKEHQGDASRVPTLVNGIIVSANFFFFFLKKGVPGKVPRTVHSTRYGTWFSVRQIKQVMKRILLKKNCHESSRTLFYFHFHYFSSISTETVFPSVEQHARRP